VAIKFEFGLTPVPDMCIQSGKFDSNQATVGLGGTVMHCLCEPLHSIHVSFDNYFSSFNLVEVCNRKALPAL